ncbi:MAG: hypothetical protein HRU26_10195, partial [Psychroserpens sp.]|nr:hypothetical protein [Psychroserpens sp.]
MKIFNRQRFELVASTRFKKYLIYAVGEIILVIIGILIALGINNWNQNRQLRNANKELKAKVLAQVKQDIEALEQFEMKLDSLNQTYRKVLKRDYDKTKVKPGAIVETVLFEVFSLSMDNQTVNLIDNAELDDSDNSQILIDLNSTYKIYFKDIDDIEQIINQKMTDNLAAIERSEAWYAELITDFICKNDCLMYLTQNEDHKARVASLRFLYVVGYGGIIEDFKEDLISF